MTSRLRALVAPAALCAAIVLAGCAAPEPSPGPGEPTRPIQVEDKLLTVDVTLSRVLVDPDGGMTDSDIIAAAAAKGMTATVDGETVVYTMSRAEHEAMLADLRAATRASADALVADESNSVTAIDYDENQSAFRVEVDAARYTPFDAFLALGFYFSGGLYQQFAGVAEDDLDVTVEFVDNATGETLDKGSLRQMFENGAD